jgi:predicted DCC family thiol-disulfide oxidoreductase YuxK
MSVVYPLRIYYDRNCPLCAHELHALKRYDRLGRIELIDCSPAGFRDQASAEAGLSGNDLMAFIHARDGNGNWLKGVPVFEAAYRAVGIESMARLWSQPRLRPLWDRLYPWVARYRMSLSKLRLGPAFGWLVARAAARASEREQSCAKCRLPAP